MSSVLWTPDPERIQNATLTAFMDFVRVDQKVTLADYDALYQWSIEQRPAFWQAVSDFFQVHYQTPAQTVLAQDQMPGAQWFAGARLNYAEHLLRFGQTDHTALVFRGEHGERSQLSYRQLVRQVAAAQGGLVRAGVGRGDRVAAIVTNSPEAVVMMLATVALGAIWSSCSPDFGLQGLVDRLGQIEPKVLVAVDGYYYNGKTIDCGSRVAEVQARITSIQKTVWLPFIQPFIQSGAVCGDNTVVYGDFLDQSQTNVHIEPVDFNHPLFILYSSGTTGVPKCIVHGHGGTLLQHLKELGLHTDVKAGDTLFYFTTCGWMMWNWQVSALALGATLVLYDGAPFYPGASALMDLVAEEQVSIFGTSARYLGALEKAGVRPVVSHDLGALRTLLSTGSPLSHESFDYVYRDIKANLCLSSISGGTDIISCFVLGCPLRPVRRGAIQCRGLGMAVQFVNDAGQPVIGQKGELCCLSSFPSMPVGFWNDPGGSAFGRTYFSRFLGAWHHGDYGELSAEGEVVIHGRCDAVLNPGGVRIGTAEIYRQLEKIPEVLDAIAIGQQWQGDTRIVLFVQLRAGLQLDEPLRARIRHTLRTQASPRHVPARIVQVGDIPKTANGKPVELAVRELVHGRAVVNRDALINPEALQYFQDRQELQS